MKIIIVGCGKMGKHLSQILTKEKYDVTVIDKNDNVLEKANEMYDISIIPGNGLVVDTLYEAGIEDTDILISTMKNDEDNILCSLLGKQMGAKHTIARVRNPEYYNQIDLIKDDLGLSMVINPERNTADEIRRILVFPSAVKVEVFEKGRVELVEHVIPENSLIADLSLIDIYKKTNLKFLICAVVRNGEVFIPSGDFVLKAGD